MNTLRFAVVTRLKMYLDETAQRDRWYPEVTFSFHFFLPMILEQVFSQLEIATIELDQQVLPSAYTKYLEPNKIKRKKVIDFFIFLIHVQYTQLR